MKNKLPEKVTGPDTVGLGYWKSEVNEMTLEELQRSHNQLIDYLAELTEVVEQHNQVYAKGYYDGQQALINPVSISSVAMPLTNNKKDTLTIINSIFKE